MQTLLSRVQRRLCRGMAALAVAGAVASGQAAPTPASSGAELVPRSVVKLVVQHPALAQQAGLEQRAAAPVAVAAENIAPGIVPTAFGKPILFAPADSLRNLRHLRFSRLTRTSAGGALVVTQYPDPVEWTIALRYADGWWTIERAVRSPDPR